MEKKRNVLIIDDAYTGLDRSIQIRPELGFNVVAVQGYSAGLEAIEQNDDLDLVVSDMTMPLWSYQGHGRKIAETPYPGPQYPSNQGGLLLQKALEKKDEETGRRTKFVLLTAYGENEIPREALEKADGYYQKLYDTKCEDCGKFACIICG